MLQRVLFRALTQRPRSSFIRTKDNFCGIKRQIHCEVCLRNPRYTSKINNTSPAIASKYQVITDTNSPVIENTVDEEPIPIDKYPILSDEFDGINLESKWPV